MLYSPWLAMCLLKACVAFTATGRGHHQEPVTISDASDEAESWRDYCPGCRRPLPQCLCNHLPPEKIRVPHAQVLVLQHPVEFRRKTISTVPLLKLVLEECRVLVGRSFAGQLQAIIDEAQDADGRFPLLLFPGPEALPLDDPGAMERLAHRACGYGSSTLGIAPSDMEPPKYLLIILDGTWTQAKRMLRNSPVLFERCQAVQFTGTADRSIYDVIRKQPAAHCLSTLESCERTLRLLEPNSPHAKEASRYLLRALTAMILTQMKYERLHLEKHPQLIRNVAKLRAKKERQRRLLTEDFNADAAKYFYNAPLPEGHTLRPLVESDARYVDSRWPFQSNKSLIMIERQILADQANATKFGSRTCLGIEFENQLVACIIRHRNGSIGILHVDEDHRGLGLGAALLREITQTLLRRKEDMFAFIVDGNKASEALFSKLGWKKANPSGKKGIGNRRAKRLWTYSLNEPNNYERTLSTRLESVE